MSIDKKNIEIFFVNKFNWLSPSPMPTVSTMSTYSMAQRGIETTLIIEGDPTWDTNTLLLEKFNLQPISNYKVIAFKRILFKKIKATPIFFFRVCKYILNREHKKRTVVISRNTTFLPYMVFLKKISGITCILESHAYHGMKTLSYIGPRIKHKFFGLSSQFRIIERIFLNRINGLICIAPPQKELYIKDFVSIPVTVLPLASRIKTPELNSSKEYQSPPNVKKLVYCGRYSLYVDIDSIFEALHKTKSINYKLIWLGIGGENRERLQKRIADEGLTIKFQLKEWVPHKEMVTYLTKEAHVGLASYKKYFFSLALLCPTKILDYFSIGLPVIAPRLPTTEHILKEKQNGLFFEPENSDSLAYAISTLFTDEELHSRLSEGARNSAKEFSWNKRSERLIQFIDTLK